jgi:uncharacterized protein YaiE (UPF0345 family)
MLKHNSYFDGLVQSIGFERNGRKQTVGVIASGTHTFGTDAPERMTVVTGELVVTLKDSQTSQHYPAGTSFEVPGKSSFTVAVTAPTAYWCEFL